MVTSIIEVVPLGGTSLNPAEPRVVARGDYVLVSQLFPILVQSGKYARVTIWTEDWETELAAWDWSRLPAEITGAA